MDSASTAPAAPFSLLETMRLDDGTVERLDRHLSRLAGAAAHFGYRWAEAAVRDALASVAARYPGGRWRVRLLLSADGIPTVECTPHGGETRRWRIDFAAEPVNPRDPFVLHKTTHRTVYENARRSRPDVDDVLLWNADGEVTESTIANVVAEIDGVRYTPPVRCGLLAGAFRAEQIDAGVIRERVLTKADIASASRLWLINSVREWVEAELATQRTGSKQ